MSEHMARHMGIYPSIYFILSIGQVKPRSSTAVVPRPRRGRGGGAWASIHLSIHPWGSIHLSIHLSGTGSSRAAARRRCRRRAVGARRRRMGQVTPKKRRRAGVRFFLLGAWNVFHALPAHQHESPTRQVQLASLVHWQALPPLASGEVLRAVRVVVSLA